MQHVDLSSGRWATYSVFEQMANIGSEVLRAIKWKKKNIAYAHAANVRALELFDLSLNCRFELGTLREIARARELWLDFFVGSNIYHQTEEQWEKYFMAFTFAARNELVDR